MGSSSGGVWGDPFEDVAIERGCIVISHFGGSRQKWRKTHRYRFQDNDWFLIGATSMSFDGPSAIETYDYNLSTGCINVEKRYDYYTEKAEEYKNSRDTAYQFIPNEKLIIRMDDMQQSDFMEVELPNETVYF